MNAYLKIMLPLNKSKKMLFYFIWKKEFVGLILLFIFLTIYVTNVKRNL